VIFSSYLFLFGFLPLFLLLYYLTPIRARSWTILLSSYLFYGWWRFDFVLLLFTVTVLSYGFALWLERDPNPKHQFRILTLGVSLNLLTLAYFKYANFGIQSLNTLLEALHIPVLNWTPVLLPIGLSFFIFHTISYLVDIYRKVAPPTRDFIDFAAFIALFPHLIAGPVLRYNLLAQQFRSRAHSLEGFSRGVTRFITGFCKKVLIADTLSPLVGTVFALPNPTFTDSWLGAVAYTLQLFFDFSGYSDMAIGLALMIGFRFPENFDHPYVSKSIAEFWRRWHISLSSWLREYLYISLGGNRNGVGRTYLNLFLTMLLGGLWHGANWTFVLWGAWHGGWLALERYLGERKSKTPPRANRANPFLALWQSTSTLLLVILGWVMFRSDHASDALRMYQGMLGLHGFALGEPLAVSLRGLELSTLVLAVALVYLAPRWKSWNPKYVAALEWLIYPLFMLAVFRLSAQSYSPFLYFQF
jgi:alginate O-acetyltransferase complex protein AlgI